MIPALDFIHKTEVNITGVQEFPHQMHMSSVARMHLGEKDTEHLRQDFKFAAICCWVLRRDSPSHSRVNPNPACPPSQSDETKRAAAKKVNTHTALLAAATDWPPPHLVLCEHLLRRQPKLNSCILFTKCPYSISRCLSEFVGVLRLFRRVGGGFRGRQAFLRL